MGAAFEQLCQPQLFRLKVFRALIYNISHGRFRFHSAQAAVSSYIGQETGDILNQVLKVKKDIMLHSVREVGVVEGFSDYPHAF